MPRKRTADALLVQGLLSTGPILGPPIPGPPIILASAVKEYINNEDIVNHASQAFAVESANGRVADTGTKFIVESLVLGSEAAIT